MMNINDYTSAELIDILIDRYDLEDAIEYISDYVLINEVERRGLEKEFAQENIELTEILYHPVIDPLVDDIYLDYTQNKDLRVSVSKLLIKSGLLIGPLKD